MLRRSFLPPNWSSLFHDLRAYLVYHEFNVASCRGWHSKNHATLKRNFHWPYGKFCHSVETTSLPDFLWQHLKIANPLECFCSTIHWWWHWFQPHFLSEISQGRLQYANCSYMSPFFFFFLMQRCLGVSTSLSEK